MRPPEEFAELVRLLSRSPYIAHEATDGEKDPQPSQWRLLALRKTLARDRGRDTVRALTDGQQKPR